MSYKQRVDCLNGVPHDNRTDYIRCEFLLIRDAINPEGGGPITDSEWDMLEGVANGISHTCVMAAHDFAKKLIEIHRREQSNTQNQLDKGD